MAYKAYYYDEQIRGYILQFIDLFTNMRVRTGHRDGAPLDIRIPIIWGSTDRLAQYCLKGAEGMDTQSQSLPVMSARMIAMDVRTESNRHHGIVDRRTYMMVDDAVEADTPEEAAEKIRVKARGFPSAFTLTMELNILAANTDQHLQILEQIMMVFNPQLDIQKSDNAWDWTALTKVVLRDVALDTIFPVGEDEAYIGSTMSFEMPIWISGPAKETINQFVGAVVTNVRDGSAYNGSLEDLNIGANEGSIAAGSTNSGTSIELVGGDDNPDDSQITVVVDENGDNSGVDVSVSSYNVP